MNSSSIKYEGWLYGLAFLIAAALRFIQLGAAPLTDSEATLALQALHLAQGKSESLAPQPAYILFTSLFFLVIESTNFMARVVPALAGSALVFAPSFFRTKIGTRPALLLAWGVWVNRREAAAGIFLGLALLSGPSVWSGTLTLLLTGVFLRAINLKPATNPSPVSDSLGSNYRLPITPYIARNTL